MATEGSIPNSKKKRKKNNIQNPQSSQTFTLNINGKTITIDPEEQKRKAKKIQNLEKLDKLAEKEVKEEDKILEERVQKYYVPGT